MRRVCIDRSELESLIAQAPDYLQDALRFFYACGWRRGEVTGLRWEYVDLAAATITLPDAKAGSRALAVTGELLEILKRRQSARLGEVPDGQDSTMVRGSDYVFHRKGQPLGDFKKGIEPSERFPLVFRHRVVVPIEHRTRLVSRDRHGHAFPHTGSHQIPGRGAPEVVEPLLRTPGACRSSCSCQGCRPRVRP